MQEEPALDFKMEFLQICLISHKTIVSFQIINDIILASAHYYHLLSVQDSAYSKFPALLDNYRRVAYSQNDDGTSFIAIIEGRDYPIYGTQFHPEKVMYEWKFDIVHDYESVRFAQFCGRFFIQDARRNQHMYKSKNYKKIYIFFRYPAEDLDKDVFYNYEPI